MGPAARSPVADAASGSGSLTRIDLETIQSARDTLSHRPIFEIDDTVWGRAADEFSDKGAPDVVLLNRPESTRNQTPQPSSIARRMGIACDDARAENRQALEA